MTSWIWTNSATLADLATVAGATVAGIALGFAWGQIKSQQSSGREATAKALYHDYMLLSLENPLLASPELGTFDHGACTINGDRLLYDQYEWFVGLLLDAGEEILRLRPTQAWRNTIERQLGYHAEYLRLRFRDYADEYEKEIRTMVSNV